MKKTVLVFIFFVFMPLTLLAQGNGTKYNLINKISWLAGSYKGEMWGGKIEEYWSSPAGNSMIGMFRLIENDEIVFSELMYIVEENNTLTMKLKHFSKELKGWEEKDKYVSFPLVKINENEVVFEGLTIKKTAEDKLAITVMIKDEKTGEAKPETFEYIKF